MLHPPGASSPLATLHSRACSILPASTSATLRSSTSSRRASSAARAVPSCSSFTAALTAWNACRAHTGKHTGAQPREVRCCCERSSGFEMCSRSSSLKCVQGTGWIWVQTPSLNVGVSKRVLPYEERPHFARRRFALRAVQSVPNNSYLDCSVLILL